MINFPITSGILAASVTISLSQSLANVAYIAAAVLFIFSLGGLSHQSTARRGNILGVVGMLLAILATIFGYMTGGLPWMFLAVMYPKIVAKMASNIPTTPRILPRRAVD